MENRGYSAYTYSGSEEKGFTLEQAREQVRVWTEMGYPSYVGKDDDPEWEDHGDEVALFTVESFVGAFGTDRDSAIQFIRASLEALNCEIADEDGRFIVYDLLRGA